MVFRENALVAGIGSGAGLAAAVLASRALASFLYETSPHDPWDTRGICRSADRHRQRCLSWAALRAARIEPITAIRYE
jgi:hypothetical protein